MNKITDCNQSFKYYDVMAMLIVMLTVVANIVSFKLVQIGPFTVRMGVFVSVASYMLAQITVEVYGFAHMRRVIWMSVISILVTAVIFRCVILLPSIEKWEHKEVFHQIFERSFRNVVVTMLSLFMGHMMNAAVIAKMKVLTRGDQLWMRVLCASFIGHGLNVLLFYGLAHTGKPQADNLISAITMSWFLRVLYEIGLLPVFYGIVRTLKNIEDVDFYDEQTNFNPFRFALAGNNK